MSADPTYYYSGSNKIPLYENSTKAVIRSSKKSTQLVQGNVSVNPIKSFSCDTYDVTVVAKDKDVTIDGLRKKLPTNTADISVYPCYKNQDGEDVIPTSFIYVELKSEADYKKLTSTALKNGCTIKKQNKYMPLWYTLQLTSNSSGDPVEIANRIMETGSFSNACPSFEVNPSISYDPYVFDQWGTYNQEYDGIDVSASEAWNYATGHGVKVAVIDFGIDLTHEDLSHNIKESYDVLSGSSPSIIYHNNDHGTHCAGIIGAVRNNNKGIAGVAPDVSLMSVSVDFYSSDIESQLADAINWSWKNGADILSCSWNSNTESPIIKQALDNAIASGRENKGCIVVFSAGNGLGTVKFPANYREEIIAVGNIERGGIWNMFSCTGDELLVCAPGTHILSTVLNNSYESMSGTSMACPHVSGVAALILEINQDLSTSDVRDIIARSVKKIGHSPYSTTKKYGSWNEFYGYGLVDAAIAVKNTPIE